MSASDQTCGNCRFARELGPEIKDLKQRIEQRVCGGGPPAVVKYAVPTPQGTMVNTEIMRPVVGAGEPACALWQPRTTILTQ